MDHHDVVRNIRSSRPVGCSEKASSCTHSARRAEVMPKMQVESLAELVAMATDLGFSPSKSA
jgi:FixJ family two-component response regulator